MGNRFENTVFFVVVEISGRLAHSLLAERVDFDCGYAVEWIQHGTGRCRQISRTHEQTGLLLLLLLLLEAGNHFFFVFCFIASRPASGGVFPSSGKDSWETKLL